MNHFGSVLVLSLSVLMVAACGSPAKPAPAQPAPAAQPAATAADLVPMCQAHFAHMHTCEDDFLSALLDLRIEVDKPAGIAAEAKANGKPALLQQAHAEFAVDSAPDKVAAICEAMATKTPADQVDRLVSDGRKCAAMTECKAFSACAVETERGFIASGAQH